MSVTAIPDRVTVVETVYHRSAGADPTAIEARFTCELATKEQPYGPRRLLATMDWQPVDLGWLQETGCGMLILRNEEGKQQQEKPTDQERDELRKKVLEVTWRETIENPNIEDPSRYSLLIPPGEPLRIRPADGGNGLMVRSQSGDVRYVLYAVPR